MSPFDAALPSTEDLFSVIEAIHDNVAIVDHNGVMRWVSSCFERNYGISRDRVIGRTTYELEAEKSVFAIRGGPRPQNTPGGHADRGHAFGAIQYRYRRSHL